MSKTKQQIQEQNGKAPEKEPMDLRAMQQALKEAEQASAHRFMIEYQRLCEEYGLEVWIHAYFDEDGRLRRDRTIRKLAQ